MQRDVNLIDLVKSFPTQGKGSTQRKVTPELFLSRDGELRDIQEFSEYVFYMLRLPVQNNFIFQSLSMSLFIHLLLEPDSYSNEYLVAKIGFDTADNEPFNFHNSSSLQFH